MMCAHAGISDAGGFRLPEQRDEQVGEDLRPVLGEDGLQMELHGPESPAAQGMHLARLGVATDLGRLAAPTGNDVAVAAGGVGVVEAHELGATEQVDPLLDTLVGYRAPHEVPA